jgi:NAD(P)-dependent dehydrogenase (short-subunit alcohol dehydrogenase family)
MKEFNSKTILITGANGVLGKKIVKNFSKNKCKLILIDYTKPKKLKHSFFYKCDFTKQDERELIFKRIQKEHKKIHIVINNAGYTGTIKDKNWITSFDKQDLKNWNNAFGVNLESIFHLVKILNRNIKICGGNIINIGSIYSILSPDPSLYKGLRMSSPAAYTSSKGGLLQLTKWLAVNLAPKIRVNMISSIGIKRNQPKKFVKRYLNKIPLKKMCKEEDIINVINFLSSKKTNMITGQNYIIDGGYSIL